MYIRNYSHYDWLDNNFVEFTRNVGITNKFVEGLISAHGDKAYSYKHDWNKNGIHFNHGVAIFILSYVSPFAETVRDTNGGWVPVSDWVV